MPWALQAGVGGGAVGDSEQIHGEGYTNMDQHSPPNGLGAKCQRAKNGSCDDGGEGFDHRLAEVNHAVRHQHHEDGT